MGERDWGGWRGGCLNNCRRGSLCHLLADFRDLLLFYYKKKKKKIFFILSSSHSVATSGQLLVSKSGFSLQIKSVDSLVDVNMRSAIAELFFYPSVSVCVYVCVCV